MTPPSWYDEAACKGMGADLFHPKLAGRPSNRVAALVAQAKAVCEQCPAASQCLAEAFLLPWREDMATGAIRGGTTPYERRPEALAWRTNRLAKLRAASGRFYAKKQASA